MPRLFTRLDSKTVMLGWVGALGLLGQLWWIPGNLGLPGLFGWVACLLSPVTLLLRHLWLWGYLWLVGLLGQVARQHRLLGKLW